MRNRRANQDPSPSSAHRQPEGRRRGKFRPEARGRCRRDHRHHREVTQCGGREGAACTLHPTPHTLCPGAKTPRIWPSAIVPWLQCSIRWDGARFAQPCVATIHETRSRAARAYSIIRCTPPAGAPQEKRAGKRAVGQILPQKGWKSANLNKLTQILHRLYDNSPRSLSRIFVFRCRPENFDFGTVVPQG